MSVYIPFDIQIKIIERLPVMSLFRFTSVSKQWKSLIRSSNFVDDYNLHSQQRKQHHLFLRHKDPVEPYRLLVDDDTFPQNKSTLFVPESINQLKYAKVVGSSHGLLCLVGSCENLSYMAVIWNPLIKKSVSVVLPNEYGFGSGSVFGFGVCPNTCDPKLVKIIPDRLNSINCANWQVEVFRLSSGAWRSASSSLPSKSLRMLAYDPVVIDGFIYRLVFEIISMNDCIYTLISFDLTSEEFKQVCLPDKLASSNDCNIRIYKLRESLAVFKYKIRKQVYTIWAMGTGASKSFTKLFTVDVENLSLWKPLGFRNNGEFIMINIPQHALVVYEPCSKQINYLWIYANCPSSYVSSCTESLLLLDQPDGGD